MHYTKDREGRLKGTGLGDGVACMAGADFEAAVLLLHGATRVQVGRCVCPYTGGGDGQHHNDGQHHTISKMCSQQATHRRGEDGSCGRVVHAGAAAGRKGGKGGKGKPALDINRLWPDANATHTNKPRTRPNNQPTKQTPK